MKKPVIAIDGYSSTGKSSISKKIAEKLGLVHLDTGALYRAVTYFGLMNYRDENGGINISALINNLDKITLEFRNTDGGLTLFLNGENITRQIRKPAISENVSHVARQPEIRQFLLERQRTAADRGGIIMDGRDIGTVVLPGADYKFFLTAHIDERTKRRFLELKNLGEQIDIAEVKNNLTSRDLADSQRETAPLKRAEDAILIDNSHLNKEQTIDLILSYIL